MKKFFRFILNWNEVLTIPIAFLLFYISPTLLRLVDSTAGVYDYGVFQKILFAMVVFLVVHGFAWIIVKLTWPGVYNFLDNEIENSVDAKQNHLSFFQKTAVTLSILFFYLYLIISLVNNAPN